jgi:hypothetical protein
MSKKTDTTNDPFEEFEFKPLTSGLGFHKNESQKFSAQPMSSKVEFKSSHLTFDTTPQTTPVTGGISTSTQTTNSVPTGFNLQSPLPRTNFPAAKKPAINVPTIEDDSITKAQSAVNEILKSLNQKKQQEEALSRNAKKLEWKSATPSIAAGFLDTMLIAAFFLLSLIAMLTITKIDLIANLSQPDPQYLVFWATASLLGGIQLIYYVSCRAFLGATPGEWAFDQRCGNELQLASPTYVLRVAGRALFNAATGFVLMTLISKIVRFDVLGLLTGLQIQRQK